MYIDDAAFGVPKTKAKEFGLRDVVNWKPIKDLFQGSQITGIV